MPKKITRLEPKERKSLILNAATKLAIKCGYIQIKRETVALEAGVAESLINRYFTNMYQLKKEIMRNAVENEILEIIAQGLAIKDPQILKISKDLKQKAIQYIS